MAGMQVVSSITTMPPDPMIAPVLLIFSKSTGVSMSELGMQPPDGPPICTALNLRLFLMPPPMSIDDGLERGAHGHLDKTDIVQCAGEREHLRALALFGPEAREPVRAVQNDRRNVRKGLDIVQHRRPLPQTLDRGERRLGPRHAALALDGRHERRLLAAHKGAGALIDLDIEVEPGAEDVLAREARGPWPDSMASWSRCTAKRILGPDIDIAVMGVDRLGGDDHAFEHRVGVRLHDAPVHERARVALVAVAQDVLDIAGDTRAQSSHLRPVRNPAPPLPRRPGFLHLRRRSARASSR